MTEEQRILQLLNNAPTNEQVLALRPSPELQARVSELLAGSKEGTLTSEETAELDRYLRLEHLVRMAKASAIREVGLLPIHDL